MGRKPRGVKEQAQEYRRAQSFLACMVGFVAFGCTVLFLLHLLRLPLIRHVVSFVGGGTELYAMERVRY